MFHAINKQSFTGLILFLLGVFSGVPDSVAITFEPLYVDAPGTGFYDRTPLTATEKTLLLADGNVAQTLGEARRNAFEAVLDVFGLWFIGNSTVRVEASFESLESNFLAAARPGSFVYGFSDPGAIGIPIALAENLLEEELNGATEADVVITFNERHPFYYGLSEEVFQRPFARTLFVFIAAHELIHGLGFLAFVQPDGSFPLVELESSEGLFHAGTIYDVNLYSERDNELLINLSSDEQRREAITSVNGLLWDGTSNGENDYSCAQTAGKGQTDLFFPHGMDSEGRLRLHAPAVWQSGSSVSHLVEATLDLMKPSYGSLIYVDFSMGMLKDMGWKLDRNNVEAFLPEETPEEFLEDCTVVAAAVPTPEPRPTPESGSGGGGCTIAGVEGVPQGTMLNLVLMAFVLVSVALRKKPVFPKGTVKQRYRPFLFRNSQLAKYRFS